MSPADEFEDTLDAIEQARTEHEERYFNALEQLRGRAERLLAAVRLAETAAAEQPQATAAVTVEAPISVPEAASAGPAGQQPWPSGGSWVRRQVNRAAHWLMHDYIATLDRRHMAMERALQAHADRADAGVVAAFDAIERVREAAERADQEVVESAGRGADQARSCFEALREALNRSAEAVDLVADLAERSRLLGDAKDAETLQRATHGPLRKMELMFDEFGRQQEVLLAELVGRRQELDALISRVSNTPEDRD